MIDTIGTLPVPLAQKNYKRDHYRATAIAIRNGGEVTVTRAADGSDDVRVTLGDQTWRITL